jgi:maleylacetate reductase
VSDIGHQRVEQQRISDQRVAQRRIIFGPVAEALPALQLPAPILVVGTARSLALIPDEAFGDEDPFRYGGARSHNPRAVVDEAGILFDTWGCKTIVAIGSSSAIDLGKAVADGRDATLVLIPTALGGAEMSRGYGIVEGDRKTGGRLQSPPPNVIYDASLLATLAPRELGSIGINAWAHTIEASYARTQHALGTAAAVTAGRNLPALLLRAAPNSDDGTHAAVQRDDALHAAVQRDDALHAALFEQAHLAGFALDARSMGLHHAVCHVIGGLTGIPHGIVNAIVLPHAVRANAKIAPAAVQAVAGAFGIPDLAAQSEAITAAYHLPRTFAELGAPADLTQRALPRVLEHALLANNPAEPDEPTVRELLDTAYHGPTTAT